MRPIYVYTIDEETGEITQNVYEDYEEGRWISKGKYWRYKKSSSYTFYVYESNLDKFVNNHVCSFNPDIDNARKVILRSVIVRRDKAEKEVKRWSSLCDKLMMGGQQ